jgi:reductive dehalogenase
MARWLDDVKRRVEALAKRVGRAGGGQAADGDTGGTGGGVACSSAGDAGSCPGMCASKGGGATGPGGAARWPLLPVAGYRFDQRMEVFKRGYWDPAIKPLADTFHQSVHRERVGYRKLDYAFQAASWSVEDTFGYETATRGGPALYCWRPEGGQAEACARQGRAVRENPVTMSRVIKRAARLYGADLVGITRVHSSWVYSHSFDPFTLEHRPNDLPPGVDTAVVMAVAMDYHAMRTAPTAVAGAATGIGYSRMAFTANILATFIRALGWRAIPCGNDTALSVPLAVSAGLGEPSRMGLLITRRYGPRVRLFKVFTDLPLATDSYRPFGALEFCHVCKTCARHCPSQAISDGDLSIFGPTVSNHQGVLKWYVNPEKCYAYWAQNRMDCSVCIRVCPFNKEEGILHDAVRGVIRHAPSLDPLIVKGDRYLGYEKALKAAEWWDRLAE